MMASAHNLTWLQRRLARGFAVETPPAQSPDWLVDGDAPQPPIAAFLPTIAGRLTPDDIDRISRNTASQLAELQHAGSPAALYIVVQYLGHSADQAELARAALCTSLCACLTEAGISPMLHSAILRGPGKVISLNAMIERAKGYGIEAAILLDDDVEMEPGCLTYLVEAYGSASAPVAIGATKIGTAAEGLASQWLFWMKAQTEPATQYPHACCMLVSMDVIEHGFPTEYSSDDGFICFELLDPTRPNPLERLPLVPDARVHHVVGGQGQEITQRIRRMMLNHYQFLCAYDWRKGRYYCRDLLFFGFWPIGRRKKGGSAPKNAVRWIVKSLYFAWFASIGAELFLRSLVNRPITHISWGSDNA